MASNWSSSNLTNDTVTRRIGDSWKCIATTFIKARDRVFTVPLDEVTNTSNDCHLIAYVHF